MITGLTDVDSVKAFWPSVVDEFPAVDLESQLELYILRSEYLLNRLGPINTSVSGAMAVLQMAVNIIVRRLIYADKHPSASAAPANVNKESVQGISYALNVEKQTVADLVGPEVIAIVGGTIIVISDSVMMMTTEQVFDGFSLVVTDKFGSIVKHPLIDRPEYEPFGWLRYHPFGSRRFRGDV